MGNLRIPPMRISSEHVAGVLRFLDKKAEQKAASTAAPTLRFPQDFPGARPSAPASKATPQEIETMRAAVAALPDQGPLVLPKFEIEDKPVSSASTGHGEGGPAVGRPLVGAELCDRVATDGISGVAAARAPVRIRPLANPSSAPAPVTTVRQVQPARQAGKTAAQERLFSSLPLSSQKVAAPSITLRPDPMAQRRERLTRAIGWLKREHRILVTVVDRDAQIRQYLVSGKRDRMLADQVFDYAVSLGMPRHG